jgi:hypothetical protein
VLPALPAVFLCALEVGGWRGFINQLYAEESEVFALVRWRRKRGLGRPKGVNEDVQAGEWRRGQKEAKSRPLPHHHCYVTTTTLLPQHLHHHVMTSTSSSPRHSDYAIITTSLPLHYHHHVPTTTSLPPRHHHYVPTTTSLTPRHDHYIIVSMHHH